MGRSDVEVDRDPLRQRQLQVLPVLPCRAASPTGTIANVARSRVDERVIRTPPATHPAGDDRIPGHDAPGLVESRRLEARGARGLQTARDRTARARDRRTVGRVRAHGPAPLYPLLARLDNCDFSGETIWHGVAAEGSAFVYDVDRAPGRRFIRAATELGDLDGAPFDVVLSSHTLEHVANPLLALSEWRRVLASPGHLVVVVPHLENTFDHRRPVTTLEHIEHDSELGIDENDPTHLEEFVELCDLARVPEQLTRDELRARARDQATFRTVHHHVFDTELVVRLLDRAGFQLLWVETALPFHIVAVARAGETGEDNGAFLAPTAAWRRESVFRRDAP